jgi:hypothetical protein
VKEEGEEVPRNGKKREGVAWKCEGGRRSDCWDKANGGRLSLEQ